jgi:hypothetical protein
MAKVGRPPKLTAEIREKIVNAIRAGNFRNVASAWMARTEPEYRDFGGREQRRNQIGRANCESG